MTARVEHCHCSFNFIRRVGHTNQTNKGPFTRRVKSRKKIQKGSKARLKTKQEERKPEKNRELKSERERERERESDPKREGHGTAPQERHPDLSK